MKINYNIDYRSQIASYHTTFPQTEQSAKILAHNRNKLSAMASNLQSAIKNEAIEKLRSSLLGANINLYS